MKINIAGTISDSIVDGPGVRYVVFAQGCDHHCKGCQNPQTWDFNKGKLVEVKELFDDIMKSVISKRVTFSGGDPFYQCKEFAELAKMLKKEGFEIVAYTGFTFEQLMSNPDYDRFELLSNIDYLVDGKFEEDKKSLSLRFKGSSNQRIIDVQKSLINWELDCIHKPIPKEF